jgi:hypothetical protein
MESKKTGKFAGNRDNASIRKMKNGESAAGIRGDLRREGVGGSSLENRSVDQVAINRFSEDDDGSPQKRRRFTGRCLPEKVHEQERNSPSQPFLAPLVVELYGTEDSGLDFLGSRKCFARFRPCAFLSGKNAFIPLNGRSVAGFFPRGRVFQPTV